MELTDTDVEFLTPNQRSFLRHQDKVVLLETLGDLIGCTQTFPLSDGLLPDVLRIDNSQTLIYFGDAKQTETSNNRDTQERLLGYLLWLSSFLSKPGRNGIFALCFKDASDLNGWVKTIQKLAAQANINFSGYKFDQLDVESNLIWFYTLP